MDKSKTESLIQQLDEKQDKIIRMRAAIALGNIAEATDEMIIALINSLKKDESSKIREEAAKSLGKIGKGQAKVASALVNSMMDDLSENVRVYATEAMGEIGEVAVPALFDVLKRESNIEVKEKAIEALGLIGQKAKDSKSDLVRVIVLEMINTVNSENKESLHRIASEAIIKMNSAAVSPLIQAYKSDNSLDVKREIEITLEKLAVKLGYRNRQALIRANDSE